MLWNSVQKSLQVEEKYGFVPFSANFHQKSYVPPIPICLPFQKHMTQLHYFSECFHIPPSFCNVCAPWHTGLWLIIWLTWIPFVYYFSQCILPPSWVHYEFFIYYYSWIFWHICGSVYIFTLPSTLSINTQKDKDDW